MLSLGSTLKGKYLIIKEQTHLKRLFDFNALDTILCYATTGKTFCEFLFVSPDDKTLQY